MIGAFLCVVLDVVLKLRRLLATLSYSCTVAGARQYSLTLISGEFVHFRIAFVLIILPMASFTQNHGGLSRAIEDNSFFIEEAYNQEAGVVQHITNVEHFSAPSRDVVFTFTQEWPVIIREHQLSFTLPFSSLNSGVVSGIGDLMLNYRYQLSGDEGDWAAVAPRLSAILPVGDEAKGLGRGVVGWQFNLPVSKRWSEHVVTHLNAGFTIEPGVKAVTAGGTPVEKTLSAFHVGGSIIALASERLNFMFEYLLENSSDIDGAGGVFRQTDHIFSPGVRYAIDVGDLQIVPGVAIPVNISGGESRTGIFGYLSFEHPF